MTNATHDLSVLARIVAPLSIITTIPPSSSHSTHKGGREGEGGRGGELVHDIPRCWWAALPPQRPPWLQGPLGVATPVTGCGSGGGGGVWVSFIQEGCLSFVRSGRWKGEGGGKPSHLEAPPTAPPPPPPPPLPGQVNVPWDGAAGRGGGHVGTKLNAGGAWLLRRSESSPSFRFKKPPHPAAFCVSQTRKRRTRRAGNAQNMIGRQ